MNRKVADTGQPVEDLRRIIRAINFAEHIVPFSAVGSQEAVPVGPAVLFGGITVDRFTFRKLLPDSRWLVYAAGLALSGDANPLTLSLVYEADNLALTQLDPVATTVTSVAAVKTTLGPFDLFATAGLPAPAETIAIIRLRAAKAAGAAGAVEAWSLWLRLLPAKQ